MTRYSLLVSHRHQVIRTETRPFTGPVAAKQNPAAHGGVTLVHHCACGATRRTNQNGRHIERGEWREPSQPVCRLSLVRKVVSP